MEQKKEIPWVHVVRILACLLVVILHSLPPLKQFSLGSGDRVFWDWIFAITRPCVPLFMMITGYLILPIKELDFVSFYKKRIPRVLFPLLFWGVVYAIIPYFLGMYDARKMLVELVTVPIKHPYAVGAILWYLFILIGIYLVLPFISPTVYKDKKMLRFYLVIWLVASVIFVIYDAMEGQLGFVPGAMLGKNPNIHTFDMLLYFTGYLGYFLLGAYIKLFFGQSKVTAINLGGVFLITLFVARFIPYVSDKFLSINSIIMSATLFVLVSRVCIDIGSGIYKTIKFLSQQSFGIFLCHMVIYSCATSRLYQAIGTMWWVQFVVMFTTFIGAVALSWAISLLPGKKYLIG